MASMLLLAGDVPVVVGQTRRARVATKARRALVADHAQVPQAPLPAPKSHLGLRLNGDSTTHHGKNSTTFYEEPRRHGSVGARHR
jgi:hypothetical protein